MVGWVCPVQRFWAPSRREREGPAPLPRWCPALPPFREQAEAAKASVASKEKAWPWGGGGRMLWGRWLERIFLFWSGWRVSLLYVFFWRAQVYKKTWKDFDYNEGIYTWMIYKHFWSCFFTTGPELRPLPSLVWFVWIRRFPQWRFSCLLILWNEHPTTYANYFVTPCFKPTMWTHFFLGKTKSPKKFDTYKPQKSPQQTYLIRNKSCTAWYNTWKQMG